MADLQFYFDPVCPWAYITSRWVVEVQEQRGYDVSWKFISLFMINNDRGYNEGNMPWRDGHMSGLQALRVASAARAAAGNDAVAAVYTALGKAIHVDKRRPKDSTELKDFARTVLSEAGLNPQWAESATDELHDEVIRYETSRALELTGKDVGTPILVFHPEKPNEASFFGPVISSIPRGAEALRLWDAVETLATTSGMAELKRSLRGAPSFD
ncbi:MAG: DsbA family protein [Ilumatobacteraceae bacterium]|jgi:protein-disulfide isomerase-like protein with CxxC motif